MAGTPIAEEYGSKSIENIKENDKVWSWDFEKKAVSLQRVVRTFKRTSNQIVHLFIGKDTIHTTPEHPFYVPQQEQIYASTESDNIELSEKSAWVLAKNLKKGMKVLLLSSLLATVDSTFAQDTVCAVYNFEVERAHNYFVGNEKVLVHNTCDVEDLIKLIKSDSYYDNLSDAFREKYDKLFDLLRTEKDLSKLKELKTRAARAVEIKNLKKAFPAEYYTELARRNLMFGKYKMVYKGKIIEENFIVISGSQNIYTNLPSEMIIEGINYRVITKSDYGQIFSKETSVFQHAENIGQAAHDSELKFYRYLSVTAKSKLGVSIANDTNEFKNIEGYIEFVSEMSPCNSCTNVIDSQARSYFGSSMKIPNSNSIPFAIPFK